MKSIKKNIVLTGFMGTGKTTAGLLVSKKLGREFIDIDQLIEAGEKMSISGIFKKNGETFFRDIETRYIKEVSLLLGKVISTGGGAVLRKENMDCLRGNGIIICLKASAETVLRNISGNMDRPLLAEPDPLKRIHELLEYREKYYRDCDSEIIIDKLLPEQVAEAVIEQARKIAGHDSL